MRFPVRMGINDVSSKAVAVYQEGCLRRPPVLAGGVFQIWKTHMREVYDNPGVFANHPDERVAISLLSERHLSWRYTPVTYLSYLSQNGTVPSSDLVYMTDLWHEFQPVGAQIWRLLVARARRDMETEGMLLTPLAASLLEEGLSLRHATHPISDSLSFGEGLDEVLSGFLDFVASPAGVRTLPRLVRSGLSQHSLLWGKVLEATTAISTPRGVGQVATTITPYNIFSLLDNPSLGQAGLAALVPWALSNLVAGKDDEPDDPAFMGSFFIRARRAGYQFSAAQVARAQEELLSTPEDDQGTLAMLACIPGVVSDRACRDRLFSGSRLPDGPGITRWMLVASQGRDWLAALAEAVAQIESGLALGGLPRMVEQADTWSLEGIRRSDLVGYLSRKDASLREAVLTLMSRLPA